MGHRLRVSVFLSFACLFLAPQSFAQLLPIVNPGFERVSRPLAVGEVTNGAGGVGVPVGTIPDPFGLPQFVDTVSVAGWRTFLPSPPSSNPIYAGVLRPYNNLQGQPLLVGYSGNHVASLRNVWMQQTLTARIQARTRYRLSFLAASGLWEPRSGIYVALLAAPDRETLAFAGTPGVATLVFSSILPAPGTEGQMMPYELEYVSPANLPRDLRNMFLAIAFIGSDGIPQMNFDDFRLEASPMQPRDDIRRPLR